MKSLCLKLFNLDEYAIQEGDTHAICLRSVLKLSTIGQAMQPPSKKDK